MRNVIVVAPSRSGHNFIKEQLKSWSEGDLLVWGFEGIEPSRYAEHKKNRVQRGKTIDFNLETTNMIHTRDLLNWWASMLTYKMTRGTYRGYEQLEGMIGIWNKITLEGFGETDIIPNKLLCVFDRFVEDQDYRKMICEYVGGDYSEEKLNFVPEAGSGSSFDKMRLQGEGSNMKTLERYEQVLNSAINDLYISCLKHCKYALETYRNFFDIDDKKLEILNEIMK